MAETLRLPDSLRREIVVHCLAADPNEACGLLATKDGDVVRVYPTSSVEPSPTSYTVPPEEHFAALEDAERRGWELGGVFHSHPDGPARPSMVDVMAALDPGWVYLVVGLDGEPRVRAWRIRDSQIDEIVLI